MNHLRRTTHQSNQIMSPELTGENATAGLSNAMMQERLLSQLQGIGKNPEQSVDKKFVIVDGLAMTDNIDNFYRSNVYIAMERLVEKEGWTEEFAAAWLGQAVVETGNPTLHDLDVVEKGSGAGRGMFQYTDARRHPYDRARQQALREGKNPNDINWQIDYALHQDNAGLHFDNLREGLTDSEKNYTFHPKWGTATGYTPSGQAYGNRFHNANQLINAYGEDEVGGYTRALSGEFTRPGTHHMDRRDKASKHILSMYSKTKKAKGTSVANSAQNTTIL